MKYDYSKKIFSENLSKLIKLNNVKKSDLAEYIGYKKSTISNYLDPKKDGKPDTPTLLKIANYFDVDVNYLVCKSGTTLKEGETAKYKIPVFHKTLLSDDVVFKNQNYLGVMSSPLPIDAVGDCYVARLYDNSMKSFGMLKGSIVYFCPEDEVKNGDIAAVLIKSKKEIFIRSVEFDKKKIVLISDEGREEFKITRNVSDAQILGKVVNATFNPNKKATD